MKRLAIGLAVAVLTAVFSTMVVAAKDRKTTIYMTRNFNTSGLYTSECIGIIATETIPSKKGEKIMWQIADKGNGQDNDEDCPSLDKTKVQLRFKDGVMGSTLLTANAGGLIQGTVSSTTTAGAHRYQLMYKGVAAGPDPEIDVDCGGCGPGPIVPAPPAPKK